jgi:hypothetical protein
MAQLLPLWLPPNRSRNSRKTLKVSRKMWAAITTALPARGSDLTNDDAYARVHENGREGSKSV